MCITSLPSFLHTDNANGALPAHHIAHDHAERVVARLGSRYTSIVVGPARQLATSPRPSALHSAATISPSDYAERLVARLGTRYTIITVGHVRQPAASPQPSAPSRIFAVSPPDYVHQLATSPQPPAPPTAPPWILAVSPSAMPVSLTHHHSCRPRQRHRLGSSPPDYARQLATSP